MLTVERPAVRNVLSFDVEDWYQGIEVPLPRWDGFERRLEIGLDRILQELRAAETRATFFVLGWVAEHHPAAVLRIAREGHEIATHGYSHTKIYELTPAKFREELRRSIDLVEGLTGIKIRGHRAPYFSITARCLWALDVLQQLGLEYDASIYPGANYRYGIPGFTRDFVWLESQQLWECPLGTMEVAGKRFGIGGAYFRIFPYRYSAAALRLRNTEGLPGCIYLHPWEFDPEHPRVRFRPRAMATHYFNLGSTLPRFRALLRDFEFTSYDHVLGLGESAAAREAGAYAELMPAT